MNATDDPFYWEQVPQRPTPAPSLHTGPTEAWRRHEAERAIWLAVREATEDDAEEGSAA